MQIGESKDIILLFAGFLLSTVGALIGARIQRAYDRRHERRPLAQLLNFGPDELLFIFPHRGFMPKSILPSTSTEDFMAINNFISALVQLDWKGKISVRNSDNVSDQDRKRNLVIICSPKSNTFTKEFQDTLKQQRRRSFFYFFEDDPSRKGTVRIVSPIGETCVSPSYEQEEECRSRGVSDEHLAKERLEDFAIITKVRNPWDEDNIVILIAGIRGIGTWAAAEFIKKRWQGIYNQLDASNKDQEFSALFRITYKAYDIKEWMEPKVLTDKDAKL